MSLEHNPKSTFVRKKRGNKRAEEEEEIKECDKDIDIIVIGNRNVGKTSLLFQYANKMHTETYIPTVGFDYLQKLIQTYDGNKVRVKFCDTSGAEDAMENIAKNLYKCASGFIVMYDVTDIQSYNDVYHWMNLLDEYSLSNSYVVIIGNKSDRKEDRKISKEEGVELAACYDVKFMETSVFQDRNIQKTLVRMISNIVD